MTGEVAELLARRYGPGRCPFCGYALATIRAHRGHCPMGLRARFAIDHDGRLAGTHHTHGGPRDL